VSGYPKVLVLHTLPPADPGSGRTTAEFDLQPAAAEVGAALPGSVVAGVRGEAEEIVALVRGHQPDVVFNACEAPQGRPDREAHVAALLEWLGIPFTGSGSETLALCRRKDRTKAVLAAAGVPVPPSSGFPCIVKPLDQDGSAGIHAGSICANEAAVRRETARLTGPVLIEAFLPGREFVVSLWGAADPLHHSLGETVYKNDLQLISYAAKWETESEDYRNSPLDYRPDLAPDLREAIIGAARGAWIAAGVRGYMRADIRLDAAGRPCVIDVNPNPEIGPDVGIYRAAEEAGWSWERFVRQQVAWAHV
jgi:D-alanine-D-alanine ligase